MKKLSSLLITGGILLGTICAQAQQKRVSPHETVSAVIDGGRVTITYGRPYTKDPKTGEPRTIWGGLVPWDKAWRTGADEATVLITQKALKFADTEVPAGAYTLYTVPSESGTSKLAISKALGAWGVPVDEKNDLARVDLKKEPAEKKTNQFTIAVVKNPAGGGQIKLMWEDSEFTASFTVEK